MQIDKLLKTPAAEIKILTKINILFCRIEIKRNAKTSIAERKKIAKDTKPDLS